LTSLVVVIGVGGRGEVWSLHADSVACLYSLAHY